MLISWIRIPIVTILLLECFAGVMARRAARHGRTSCAEELLTALCCSSVHYLHRSRKGGAQNRHHSFSGVEANHHMRLSASLQPNPLRGVVPVIRGLHEAARCTVAREPMVLWPDAGGLIPSHTKGTYKCTKPPRPHRAPVGRLPGSPHHAKRVAPALWHRCPREAGA